MLTAVWGTPQDFYLGGKTVHLSPWKLHGLSKNQGAVAVRCQFTLW